MLSKIPKILIHFQIGILVVLSLLIIFSQVAFAGCYYAGSAVERDRCSPGCRNFCMCDLCDTPSAQCNIIISSCCGNDCCWSEWICSGCDACPGGCFTGETQIDLKETGGVEKARETEGIKNLKEGDVVSSFNPKTGEISEGIVSNIQKYTREGFYTLEIEGGKEVKVTAEHPFLAVENESFIAKLREVFSHTLTYQLITGLQAKVAEVVK